MTPRCLLPCRVGLDYAEAHLLLPALQTLAITPWNPHPALAIALLRLAGPQWLGAVFLATRAAEVVVRGAAIPWPQSMIVAGVAQDVEGMKVAALRLVA